ncbi:P-loop containing nucleoside triphosphate hydrolase protein, partial [Scenedesmus sp. NREL 46B-D3]
KLYLVDLAGSENIKRSGAEGKQQVEAGDINKSLCHLKTVIHQVFRGKKVPTYRNSNLTFKLQDALGGGNSKLLFIACISTARENLTSTKETLRFAEMARRIKNKPTVNRELKDEIITRLQLQVRLQEYNASAFACIVRQARWAVDQLTSCTSYWPPTLRACCTHLEHSVW